MPVRWPLFIGGCMLGSRGANTIFNGLVALALSLIIWRLTGIWWAWAILFGPGAALVFYGWYLIIKGE